MISITWFRDAGSPNFDLTLKHQTQFQSSLGLFLFKMAPGFTLTLDFFFLNRDIPTSAVVRLSLKSPAPLDGSWLLRSGGSLAGATDVWTWMIS